MISKEQISDWREWISDHERNLTIKAWKAVLDQAEAAIELRDACRKLLAISLPSDVSGNRMRQEAIDTITKANLISIAPKGG